MSKGFSRFFRISRILSSVLLLLPFAVESALALQAGFGRAQLTPPLEDTWIDADGDGVYEPRKGDSFTDVNGNGRFDAYWIAGFGQSRPASGVHDDIWALASVFDDGQTRVAFVVLDLIGFLHDDVLDVRRALPTHWNIDHAVVISTHNHEAPDVMGIWGPNLFTSGVNRTYLEFVKKQAVAAIGQAVETLRPAAMRTLQLPAVAGDLVHDTRKPHVLDNGIQVLQVFDLANGETLGSLVNWSNHPEVLWDRNTLITADFVGYVRDGIEHGLRYPSALVRPGIGGTHLYVNGALGGLLTPGYLEPIHDPFLNTTWKEPSFEKARAVGYRVADAVLNALQSPVAQWEENPRLRSYREEIRIPVRNAKLLLAATLGILDRKLSGFLGLKTEVGLVTLGSGWFAQVPGEIYPEIVNGGVENPPGADFRLAPVEVPPLRDRMQGRVNFVLGLANDELGYIIPRSEWDEKKPYLYLEEFGTYGEENSVGPDAAPIIHRALLALIENARTGPHDWGNPCRTLIERGNQMTVGTGNGQQICPKAQ